jgi:tetratricopeptide (TPR) repeat protein
VIHNLSREEKSRLAETEDRLRQALRADPNDVSALRTLGNICLRLSRHEEAGELLSKAVALQPRFAEARWLLVGTYVYRGDWKSALAETDTLLAGDPENCDYLDTKAYALLQLGEYEKGAAAYEALAKGRPSAETCTSWGRALKSIGRTGDAITAYRQALRHNPHYGMAWWSLAELKTFRFEAIDIESMKTALDGSGASPRNRALIQFALGRAYEDEKEYE